MQKVYKKYQWIKAITLTTVLISPILGYAIYHNNRSYTNSSDNINVQQATYSKNVKSINTSEVLKVNLNNALSLSYKLIDDTNYFGSTVCTINNGVLVGTTDNGIKLINQDTSQVTNFTNNYTGKLLDIKYNASLQRVIILTYYNENITAYSFNMNGERVAATVLMTNKDEQESTNYALFNINNTNEYIAISNAKSLVADRVVNTRRFTLTESRIIDNGFIWWDDGDSAQYNIVAMGNIKVNNNDYLNVQLLNLDNRWVFKLYNNWKFTRSIELPSSMVPNWAFNSGIKTLNEIVIQDIDNKLIATSLVAGSKSALFNLSISTNEIKLISGSAADGFISLNESEMNIDIARASVFNNIITFSASNWSTSRDTTIENKISIGALNIANPTDASNPLSKNNILSLPTSSKLNNRLRRYDYFSNNTNVNTEDKFKVLATSNFNLSSGELIAIRNPQEIDMWFIDASKNETGGWSYLTSLLTPTSEIAIDNMQDVNPFFVTSSDIQNNQTTIQQIKNQFTLYRQDTNVTITKKENQEDYWVDGKVPVNISFDKAFDINGILTNMQFDVVLTGFATYEKTTNVPSEIALSDVNDIVASDIERYKTRIARSIVDSNQITNTAFQQELTANDIEIEPIISTANNTKQTIDVNLIIKNRKFWQDGEIYENSPSYRVKLTGFKIQNPTNWKNNNEVDNSEWRTLYPTEINDNQISNFIKNNINYFFNNVPEDAIVFIYSKEPDIINGKLRVKFQLTQWYDEKGVIQNDRSRIYTLTFTNLKNDNLSTLIFENMNLDLSNVYASEIKFNYGLIETIKQTIIDKQFIYNIANNETLNTSDLNIEIIDDSINNVRGEIRVWLTINNSKYWYDGYVESSYSKEVMLTGFKKQNPTNQIETEYNNPAWSNIAAANFSVDEITTFINDRKDVFFINLPSDARIQVVADSLRPNGGLLNFRVTLTKYYDEKGLEKNYNSPIFDITFYGFKTTNITTYFPETIPLDGFSNTLASEIQDNQYSIRTAIYAKRNLFVNTNGVLSMTDISFQIDEANNVEQKLVVNLSIGNDKYWNNGVVQPIHTQKVTLTGFKLQNATNTNISIEFPSSSQNIEQQKQDLLDYINSGVIKPDEEPYYIPDSNGDGIINDQDLTIEIVEKNEYDEYGNVINKNEVIVIKPNKFYNDKGVLEPNYSGSIQFQISVNKINKSPTQSNKIDWTIIIIVCSIVGGILLILLLYLLIRSQSKRGSYDDFDYVDYY